MADGAANPYTATAAVLQAARLGFAGGLDCPAPETSDALETADADDHCPHSLPEALDALEADATFADALGRELVDHFVVIKRAEYDRFAAAPTDWELSEYLPFH
jgi:glutamine synthetase